MPLLRRRGPPPLGPASAEPLVPTFHDDPLRLLVVFERLPAFDAERLRRALHEVDPGQPDIRAEIVSEALEGTTHGLAGWGPDEVVHVDGNAKPPEPTVLDPLLGRSTLDARVQAQARAGQGHVVLTDVGRAGLPEDGYRALVLAAAALCGFPGAVLVGDRVARTSIAARDLRRAVATGSLRRRGLPRFALACGVEAAVATGWRGSWSRTWGVARFGLPDLARHTATPEPHDATVTLFEAILDYLRASGATIRPGDQVDAGTLRLVARAPRAHESWLRSETPLLVLEDRAPAGGPTG